MGGFVALDVLGRRNCYERSRPQGDGMRFIKALSTLIFLSAVLISSSSSVAKQAVSVHQSSAPDVILSGGKIITVDDRFSIAQAVAVQNDRVVAVGSNREIALLAGPNTRKIDLQGKTVIPGLIENHAHFMRAGATWQREFRLDGVVSGNRRPRCCALARRQQPPANGSSRSAAGVTISSRDDPTPFSREELDRIAP